MAAEPSSKVAKVDVKSIGKNSLPPFRISDDFVFELTHFSIPQHYVRMTPCQMELCAPVYICTVQLCRRQIWIR